MFAPSARSLSKMAAPVFHPRNMVYKNLGSTGLKVSAFSLGGWLTYGGTVNGDPVKAIMKLAFESGVNTFDSAEICASSSPPSAPLMPCTDADGKCEIEMGRVIKELNCECSGVKLGPRRFLPSADLG